MSEIGIVGDIHGRADVLRGLIARASERTTRFVFLGDYVNRGRDSRGVIEFLSRMPGEGYDCVFLAGNHDRAFMAALEGDFDRFLLMGGAATVRSYVAPPYMDVQTAFAQSIPSEHVSFVRALADEFETEDLRVAHRVPVDEFDGRFRVGGHAPQWSATPTITETTAYIDTGCGTLPHGALTCLFWPSKTWLTEPASD